MKTRFRNQARWLAVNLLSVAATLSAPALTPAEATGVLYMKQEEKVARDVYQALFLRWDHVTFRNIATAEQRHMDAIDGLIARYGLTDATPAEAGRFSIPELQKLHDDLLALGNASLVDALRVGIEIEEADIADLKEAIRTTREPMIRRVFGNLLRASGQHLNAFNAALGNGDTTGVANASAMAWPRCGVCVAPDGAAGRGGYGRNAGACRQNGAANGNSATCPRVGVCPAWQCPEGCVAPEAPNQPRVGTPLRRGRR